MIRIEGNKAALYQWDLNQRLILSDIGLDVEAHFSCSYDDKDSLVLLTYEDNGLIYCNIPNILLQRRGVIYVYLYVREEDQTYTKHHSEILVIPREKPDDYVYTETEVFTYMKIEGRVKTLEQKMAKGVFTVNDKEPDENGNVEIDTECITKEEILSLKMKIKE